MNVNWLLVWSIRRTGHPGLQHTPSKPSAGGYDTAPDALCYPMPLPSGVSSCRRSVGETRDDLLRDPAPVIRKLRTPRTDDKTSDADIDVWLEATKYCVRITGQDRPADAVRRAPGDLGDPSDRRFRQRPDPDRGVG